jgi:hypothetical protein
VVPLLFFGLLPAGCDGVFGLTHVTLGDQPDAPSVDATCVPVGHDEDGDALDDACDPCPFDADNSGDADGDGIALACDPDPTKPNQRVFFTGFDPASRSQLTVMSGSYTQDEFAATGVGMHAIYWNGNPDGTWVIAGVDVTGIENDSYRELGPAFDAAPSTTSEPNGAYCVLGYSTLYQVNDYMEVYRRDRPNDDALVLHDDSALPLDLFHGVIRASYDRAALPAVSCSFATSTTTVSISGTPMSLPASGKLALTASSTDATFRSLFVVRK